MSKLFLTSLCLLFHFTASSSQLKSCDINERLALIVQCRPLLQNLKTALSRPEPEETAEETTNLKNICEKTINCFAQLKCKEAYEMEITLKTRCHSTNKLSFINQTCLKKFFKNGYLAKYSTETSCFKDYPFVEKDLIKKREAYKNGKSCFFDYVKNNCHPKSFEYLSIDENYNYLVKSISNQPEEVNCQHDFYYFNTLQCLAIADETRLEIQVLNNIRIEANDSRVAHALRLCRDTENCMDGLQCMEQDRAQVEKGCNLLQVFQSNFGVCISKITNERPDLSKFDCLKGTDFFDTSLTANCEKFGTKRECTKSVMKDICGENALMDYDQNAEKISNVLKCRNI